MIYTTLNEIRRFDPCVRGWSRLLSYLGKTAADDDPLPLVTVLDSNGLEDAIWCLRVCPDIAAEFAQWCADWAGGADDRAATRVADRAAGNASYYAARAAGNASYYADRAAGNASYYAARAADAAGSTERQVQADKLRELLS